ncbi:NACHT domain-containing protein [[Leptolyngbya] sp. PCC 7376]|uniref:NACHT domain-containing protein n=1 Tax=[Leptolyngbya] sp. PCC 7376 TaxID=111781 RepID=UPI001CEC975A|nr:NACHT domain-containing protein [[Leptolyngbya] sp. PCC 7376]
MFALLDFANDSLDADESQVDRLRDQIEAQWQSSERLVIRTKLRYLQTLSRLATPDAPLTLPQIKTALKSFTGFLEILEDNRTITRGSENWHFTLTFWGDRWERDYNIDCFEQAWESCRSGGNGEISTQQKQQKAAKVELKTKHDWPSICRNALNTRLTSNPLTASDGMVFELGDLYVPLGVVANDGVDENSDSDADLPSYTPELFFQNHIDREQPNRLAIVGEPGTGKTTFLQQLALHLGNTKTCLPVWISLADLDGRSLEDYITSTWLRQALKQFAIASETINEFASLIEQGKVWFLLDALDEMGDPSSRAATTLAHSVESWLGNAHVVLTCRSTVWKSGKNPLAYFTTYRCQSFGSDNQQLENFIQQWFQQHSSLGDRLIFELNRRVNNRIHAVVRHPLYLTLLCRTWQLTQGKLPTTKAILYRQFVDAFYEWKQDAFPTTRTQRQTINKALGQLALQGLQNALQQFRFRQREVENIFDAFDPDLLTVTLQLGWLDVVGKSEETSEKIYGFYHQTFQEYFAATAIAQWQDLVAFQQSEETRYPAFEYGWQEIILLWLGREDIANTEKEAFLQTLWQWQDNCGGFYSLWATCMVGKGLAEFPDFSEAKTVINQLIQWRFETPKDGISLPPPIINQAGIALSRSDRQLTIPALENFLEQTNNPFDQWLAAHSLGKNHDPGNKRAITILEKLLAEDSHPDMKLNLCRSLGLIDPTNKILLQTLTQILQTESKTSTLRKAALRLGRLYPAHPLAITTLETLFKQATEKSQRSNILDTLSKIAPDNPLIPTQQASKTPAKTTRKSRQKTPREVELATATILKKLDQDLPLHKRIYHITKLANFNPSHPIIIPTLIEGLAIARCKTTLRLIIETLAKIVEGNHLREVLPQVREIYLNSATQAPSKRTCYKILWEWSKDLSYPDFQGIWQSGDRL